MYCVEIKNVDPHKYPKIYDIFNIMNEFKEVKSIVFAEDPTEEGDFSISFFEESNFNDTIIGKRIDQIRKECIKIPKVNFGKGFDIVYQFQTKTVYFQEGWFAWNLQLIKEYIRHIKLDTILCAGISQEIYEDTIQIGLEKVIFFYQALDGCVVNICTPSKKIYYNLQKRFITSEFSFNGFP